MFFLAQALHNLRVKVVLSCAVSSHHELVAVVVVTVLLGVPDLGLALGRHLERFRGERVESGVRLCVELIELVLGVLCDLVEEIIGGFKIKRTSLLIDS